MNTGLPGSAEPSALESGHATPGTNSAEPRSADDQHDTGTRFQNQGAARQNIAYGGDHRGDINQTEYHNYLSVDELFREQSARVPAHTLTRTSLSSLSERFVRPSKYERARAALDSHGVVLVTGPIGTGRQSAAMMLLYAAASEWQRISCESDIDEEADPPAPDSLGDEAGLLLDLSRMEPVSAAQRVHRYQHFLSAVREKRCPIVLVLSPLTPTHLDADWRRRVVAIGRPPGARVLAAHLRFESISCESTDLDLPAIREHLRVESMGELARLAILIREARTDVPGRPLADYIDRALAALGHGGGQLAAKVHGLGGRDRALLFASAMLSGSDPGTIVRACQDLLSRIDYAEDDTHALDQKGITTRLSTMDIEVGIRRVVHFNGLNADATTRSHFWSEYPELRQEFHEWSSDLVLGGWLSSHARDKLALRFAQHSLDAGGATDLVAAVTRWVNQPHPWSVLRCAKIVLRAGLAHEESGRHFRRLVYEWASPAVSTGGLHTALGFLLVELCGEVIAPTHPDQALVRLHHLARRDTPTAGAAREQIRTLTGEPGFLRMALHRLAENPWRKHLTADTELFLELIAVPRLRPVLADSRVRDQLTAGWRTVLLGAAPTWESRAHEWFSAAHHPDHLVLLDVLVAACDGRINPLGALNGAARRWVGAASVEDKPARTRVASLLRHRIDNSQHLDFLTTTGDVTS